MNRVALITGAGRGIGRAAAVRLSEAGHDVVLTARTAHELRATADLCPGGALVVPADLTDPGAVEHVFATAERDVGPVAILVAGAGAGYSASLPTTTDEAWNRMLELNLTVPFRCLRRAVPAMVSAGWGRIVVVASIAAKQGAPYIAAYAAAKHGVLGLVRSAAAELARTGVTVNAVCPSYVDTALTDATVDNIAARTGRTRQQAREFVSQVQPIGRLITPEEVADAVAYCVASAAVTGQGLNVDGGALQS